METVSSPKRRNPFYTLIDVSIVIVHLAVVALILDWVIVSSFNLNLLGTFIVAAPTMALIVFATVKLWMMNAHADPDRIVD